MIFVTGGSGLAGRHILDELRARGLPTVALVRDDCAAAVVSRLGATPHRGSADDPEMWGRIGDCTAIVHAAALVTARAPWEEYERINVGSVRHAAARARALGVPLIHLSSVAVYGRKPHAEPVTRVEESFPIGPLNDPALYPRSKRLAEAALWEAAGAGARVIALRPCVIYGEGDRQFLPRVVAIARRGWLPVIGTGERPLALVHGRSVAQVVAQALGSGEGWGRAYNVTNDDAITPPEFVQGIAEGLDRPIRARRLPLSVMVAAAWLVDGLLGAISPARFPAKASGAVRFWRGGNPYSSEAARRILGWSPTVRHREALPRAVKWLVDASGHG